jgi:glycosyltransferase involved in cell wall biosynthesis
VSAEQMSCIICAFNEGSRIAHVLRATENHPLLGEVIVIDDGSTDDTAQQARAFEHVRVLGNAGNRGKSWSLARGVEAARFDYIMLLDADLAGLRPADITDLAAPVLNGSVDVSLSLRRDSLYRAFRLDFVSGERVLPRALLVQALPELRAASPWGAEVLINRIIIAHELRVAIVDWKTVTHASKLRKRGLKGALADMDMAREIVSSLTARGLLRQNLALRNATRH